jgi:1,4-alpha-glucan branching enzyme
MGWMNDSLRYIAREPIHRRHHQGEITFSMLYAYHEHFILVLSHDEVVHGKGALLNKMPGDDWQKAANLRMFLSWMWTHPGKKLLFQGGELGQWTEWNHNQSIDWHLVEHQPHTGIQRLVRRLNELYLSEPALSRLDDRPEGFEWVDFHDADNTVWSFLRKAPVDSGAKDLLVIVNATPVPRDGYRIGVPESGQARVVLNSDDSKFWGSGYLDRREMPVDTHPIHGRPSSITLDLSPLSVVILRLE